ncbi:retrovirus-related pol polyprotein from transposon TNT 1-94 [Tanacetum coccineum]
MSEAWRSWLPPRFYASNPTPIDCMEKESHASHYDLVVSKKKYLRCQDFLRWVEAEKVNFEVGNEKWRTLLLREMCVAFDVLTDGREEDLFSRIGNVAKLLQENEILHKENETVKRHYKELYDSINVTRNQTKLSHASLIEKLNQNSLEGTDFKVQLQDKSNVNVEMRNLLKKMKGKSVETKFVKPTLVEIILFIVDSGCSKHMTGNLKLLSNFVEKYLGTVKFGNDQIALILVYGDLVQANITIKRVYYVEGLNHNLFSVGQFCDADLEVAFQISTCYVRYLKENDLLTGSCGINFYSITLQDTSSPNLICLMAKATSSQAWLWHRRLSHLNFDSINLLSKNDIVIGLPKLKFIKDHLCSSCELGKAKRKSFETKNTPSSKRRLQLLHMDLCGPMRVESINGKKYVLVIVDDYSRYTWTHFLRSEYQKPEVFIDFLRLIQRGLHAQVRTVRTDKGTEFLNKTLHEYFAKEGRILKNLLDRVSQLS